MHEALADGHRLISDRCIEAAKRGEQDLKPVAIPDGLLDWLQRLGDDLAAAIKRVRGDSLQKG